MYTKQYKGSDIIYVNGIVKESLVKEVKKKLENINIDGIIDSGYLNYKVLPENATNKSVKFEII